MNIKKHLKFDLQLFDNEYIVGTEGDDDLSYSWGHYATVNSGAGDDTIYNYYDEVLILAGVGNDVVDNSGGGGRRSMPARATTPFGISIPAIARLTAEPATISSPISVTPTIKPTTRRSSAAQAMIPSKTPTTLTTRCSTAGWAPILSPTEAIM
ncbi:MAG: calcium-binding protein [Selenomonadaceae bacterium]|nr:calcium-binding protein [Selenomonadaceae bacterium]